MRKLIIYFIVIMITLLFFFSCKPKEVEKKTLPTTRRQITQTPDAQETIEPETDLRYVYQARSRRDPFKPILNIESKVDIDKVKLVGFYNDKTRGKPKAILEDETGNSHYLVEGDFIGDAKLVSINVPENKIIFEIQKDYYVSKKTLLLED